MSGTLTVAIPGLARHLRDRSGLLLVGLAAALAITTQSASAVAAGRAATVLAPAASASTQPLAVSAPADDRTSLQPAANRLLQQTGGNPAVLARIGREALAQARNEATIATFLRLPWLAELHEPLERYGGKLDGPPAELSIAVAGVQRYGQQIHDALLHRGPDRLVIISLQAQRLFAYERGRTVVETPVTTGRPELSTDVGPMHVIRKDSPWTMQSPWPKGSPYWYPDTKVEMVAWFTATGEGLHDAAWEPASAYGAGSQDGAFASHGCVHVPPAAEVALYNWVTVGTPVVVYPGDGSTVSSQVWQRSVDAFGRPVTGDRGV